MSVSGIRMVPEGWGITFKGQPLPFTVRKQQEAELILAGLHAGPPFRIGDDLRHDLLDLPFKVGQTPKPRRGPTGNRY